MITPLCNRPVVEDDGDGESGPRPHQVGICTRPPDHPGDHMDLATETNLRLNVLAMGEPHTEAPIVIVAGALYVPSVLPGILDEDEGYVALGRVVEIATAMIPDAHSNVVRLEVVHL